MKTTQMLKCMNKNCDKMVEWNYVKQEQTNGGHVYLLLDLYYPIIGQFCSTKHLKDMIDHKYEYTVMGGTCSNVRIITKKQYYEKLDMKEFKYK